MSQASQASESEVREAIDLAAIETRARAESEFVRVPIFMHDESGCISTIRAIVERVMSKLGHNPDDFRKRDELICDTGHYLDRHAQKMVALVGDVLALTARLFAAEAELAEAQADEELAARGAVEMLHQAEQIQGRLSAAEASLSAIVAVLDEAGAERERALGYTGGNCDCIESVPLSPAERVKALRTRNEALEGLLREARPILKTYTLGDRIAAHLAAAE